MMFAKTLPRAVLISLSTLVVVPAWADEAVAEGVKEVAASVAPALPASNVSQFDVSGVLSSLVLVSLGIVAVVWLLRRSRLVAGHGLTGVSIVGQIPLSMKEKLLVVQVGDQKLLLGCTSASINTLHSWASAKEDAANIPESAFAKLLNRLPANTVKAASKDSV
jgi:flagellar protein FliO/FliZ